MAEGKDAGGFHYDASAGGNGPPTGGKRRLIRGGGGDTPRVRDHVRPRDPCGGVVSTVSPQRTITDDVFQTVEQSGGGPWLSSPIAWTECTERTMSKDTQRQECPHDDDLEIRPLPGATTTPVPLANGPQLGPCRVAVVRVEETPAGDASGSESPCAKTDRQRLIDLPEVAGNGCPALLPPPPSWFDEL